MKCILTPSMKGEQERGEDVFPNHSTRHLSPCLFLHRRNSNLGTNLCVVVTKIEELPDWESAFLHSRGNNKSLGLLSRRAPWRVACVRRSFPLPCLSHLSSNLPPTPHHSLPPLSIFPPHIPISSATVVTSEVVPRCWGPEGTPLACAHVCLGERLMLFALMTKHNRYDRTHLYIEAQKNASQSCKVFSSIRSHVIHPWLLWRI